MRVGPIFRLFQFFSGARDYARTDDDAIKSLGAEAPRHQTYHRVIVICGIAGMVIGLVSGIIGAIASFRLHDGGKSNDAYIIYLMPVLTAAAGMLGGAAWACAFAPSPFLTGPLGAKWLKLVGTRNLAVARGISFVVATLTTGFCVVMTIVRDSKP